MASTPITPARTKTAQLDANSTRKSQKAYQVSDEFNAKEVNDEFDRIHERINQLVVESAALDDLTTTYVAGDMGTAAAIAAALNTTNSRINALYAVMRQAGLFRQA